MAIHLDNALLNLLYEIKHSGFLSDVETRKDMKQITNATNAGVHEGQQKLYDYIQLLLKLKTYKFDKHEHKIEFMSPEEEISYKQNLKDMSPYISAMIKQNGKFRIYKGNQQIN